MQMPRECPPEKILNPLTGRCVKRDAKIGKRLLALANRTPRSGGTTVYPPITNTRTSALVYGAPNAPCPDDKIRNPSTGRCVKADGAIGRRLSGVTKSGVTKSGVTKSGVTKAGVTKAGVTKPSKTKIPRAAIDTGRLNIYGERVYVNKHGEPFVMGWKVERNDGGKVRIAPTGNRKPAIERRPLSNFMTSMDAASELWLILSGIPQPRPSLWVVSLDDSPKNPRVALLHEGVSIISGEPGTYIKQKGLKQRAEYDAAVRRERFKTRATRPLGDNNKALPLGIRWIERVRARLRAPGKLKGKSAIVKLPRVYFNTKSFKRIMSPDHTVRVEVFDDQDNVSTGRVVGPRGSDIDDGWFVDQARYLYALSDDDLMTVMAYTLCSHTWLGPFQRNRAIPSRTSLGGLVMGPHVSPLYPQLRDIVQRDRDLAFLHPGKPETRLDRQKLGDPSLSPPVRYKAYQRLLEQGEFTDAAMLEALNDYVARLQLVLSNAPPVRRPIVVYRGTRLDPFVQNRGRLVTRTQAFVSCAFTSAHAMQYARSTTGRLQRLTLLPGTRALVVASINKWNTHGEYEVVLGVGARLEFVAKDVTRFVFDGPEGFTKVPVTEIIAS